LTSPLPVCLSDGGHARPCDPSDLIRCRKYVKSQKARGRGTGTPVHTRHKHSVEYDEGTREEGKRETRGGTPQVSFPFPVFLLVNL